MSADGKKTKEASPKKEPVKESKVPDASPKADGVKAETKPEAVKADAAKPDAASPKQGMGEGQKAVTQAYKDNWNAIFGKKKKR